MNAKELIGKTITDIFVRSKMEVGGLDEAEVFIEMENEVVIAMPWDFESENKEQRPGKDWKSIFSDLSDVPEFHINPERKTIAEILEVQKKRATSVLGRIKKFLGVPEGIPGAYMPYKIQYRENRLKHLKNQKIADFLMFEDVDSAVYIELENGYIITETKMSPHGTGMAGLNYFESLAAFEDSCGTNYTRLNNKSR
jgi:hypothetical protein